jgi:hypothetical protein
MSLGGMAQRGLDVGRGFDGLVQEGGTVWRHGGVDGRLGEGFHFGLTPWRWLVD